MKAGERERQETLVIHRDYCMFYKVNTNTELGNRSSWGTGRVRLLQASGHISSIHQYTALFYVCFCLKTPYLIHIIDSLNLN